MSDTDDFPDDFANLDVDWDAVPGLSSQSAPAHASPTQAASRSSSYFSGDSVEFTESFFAQLDAQVDHELTQGSAASSSSVPSGPPSSFLSHGATLSIISQASTSSTPRVQVSPSSNRSTPELIVQRTPHPAPLLQPKLSPNRIVPSPPRSLKRQLSASPVRCNKKGKTKARDPDENIRHMLQGIEDELMCPICCDLLVAPHLGNPCGHSYCGECGWQWIEKNAALNELNTCAVCRGELSKGTPLLPNIAMQSTVEKHVEQMISSGQWQPGSGKVVEWQTRKQSWKDSVIARTAIGNSKMSTKAMSPAASVQVTYFELAADGELYEGETTTRARSRRGSRRR